MFLPLLTKLMALGDDRVKAPTGEALTIHIVTKLFVSNGARPRSECHLTYGSRNSVGIHHVDFTNASEQVGWRQLNNYCTVL